MFCQSCGVEAHTKYVASYQNIGALLMRFIRLYIHELAAASRRTAK
jgi:hypothetical protein